VPYLSALEVCSREMLYKSTFTFTFTLPHLLRWCDEPWHGPRIVIYVMLMISVICYLYSIVHDYVVVVGRSDSWIEPI